MKVTGDARKLKKLDIKVSYVRNLRKFLMLFDNLIDTNERFSGKVNKTHDHQEVWRGK